MIKLGGHWAAHALGGGGQRKRRWVSNLNKYYPIIFKLGDNVYGHNISAKFENGYCRPGFSIVIALR